MKRFLAKRLWQVAGTIFGVVTLIFFLQRLTGDPTYLLVPETATQADIEAMRRSLGFDRPLVVQYLSFLKQLASFDLGRSVIQNVPVSDHHRLALPYTLQLAGGRPAGRLRAWDSRWDRFWRSIATAQLRAFAREHRSRRAEHADFLERDYADHDFRRERSAGCRRHRPAASSI